jgi:L-rhamnose isomerase
MSGGAVERAYEVARERYAEWGVDTEAALERLGRTPISVQCWQGDDVGGFESGTGLTGGGIMATGSYPGKARTADELRADLELVFSLLPGSHRLNLHASYAETGGIRVDRDALEARHFSRWISWAKEKGLGLDFNPTYFSHPKADAGATLTAADEAIRRFWVQHGIACRRIGAAMGRALGKTAITNLWIPDGSKDSPIDRKGPRERLARSLDEIFAEAIDPAHNLDAVESKLFGLGAESYTAGSHEFYLSYAVSRQKMLCLDLGHFHPTESVADKLSAILPFVPELLVHVSRGVRWDSDHVVILCDELRVLMEEVVRGDYLGRVHIALDFFDASINRVAAWVTGTRATLKALLIALLEPTAKLREAEQAGDNTARLALLEEVKGLPFGSVWDHWCERNGVPVGPAWLRAVKEYESRTTPGRM